MSRPSTGELRILQNIASNVLPELVLPLASQVPRSFDPWVIYLTYNDQPSDVYRNHVPDVEHIYIDHS
jgi:hypothetical protein